MQTFRLSFIDSCWVTCHHCLEEFLLGWLLVVGPSLMYFVEKSWHNLSCALIDSAQQEMVENMRFLWQPYCDPAVFELQTSYLMCVCKSSCQSGTKGDQQRNCRETDGGA